MADSLLPKRFLFRFSAPCWHHEPLWTNRGADLDAKYRLVSLAELEDRASAVDFRVAWSEGGLSFSLLVQGKRQAPWCRANRPEESEGLQVWIDTRDVHNVHRASRFCHWFIALPFGGGGRADQPLVQWMPIPRARDNPGGIAEGLLQARSERLPGGYRLDVLLPAASLTGYEPAEHPRLGFTYAVIDRELGEQTLSAGAPLPYREDPSLWATLELVEPIRK